MPDDPVPAKPALPAALQHQLRSMASDMNLLGITELVIGALYCITIVGAAIGVPMIFAGLRLKNSGESFSSYSGAPDPANLRSALDHLGRHFRIHKILLFVSIGFLVLYILFMIVIFGVMIGDRG